MYGVWCTFSKIPAQFCTLTPLGWGEVDYDLKLENAKNLARSPESGKIQNLPRISVPPSSLQDGKACLNTAKNLWLNIARLLSS